MFLKNKKGSMRFLFFMHVYLMHEVSHPKLPQKQIHPDRYHLYGVFLILG